MAEPRDPIVRREAALLRALCRAGIRERGEAAEALAGYRWREPDHQWIFDALCEAGASEQGASRESLAQRLTRQGFPDIDLESLFDPAADSGKAVRELARELLDEASGCERSG
jgi:hypothetical protein